jgi:ABC-2 type transport system ATP-binding protein
MSAVIRVQNLTKSYGPVTAVQGIDFEVHAGEIFAMLGPNGAGKSTTVEVLEGLRHRDAGEVAVLGIDPAREPDRLKSTIGVALQSTGFPAKIRVVELVDLYGRLYRTKPNTKELLERFDLSDKARAFYETLSGGQKQKVALILAMINNPTLVFLDEPTTGLDAHTRRRIHDWLRELRTQGRTVFLTTHYIHEAEQLADRVAILSRGKIIRQGTVDEVARGVDVHSQIRIRTAAPLAAGAAESLAGVVACRPGERSGAPSAGVQYQITVHNAAEAVASLVRLLDSTGNRLLDVEIWRPTLEDLFLRLTGEQMDAEHSGEGETS